MRSDLGTGRRASELAGLLPIILGMVLALFLGSTAGALKPRKGGGVHPGVSWQRANQIYHKNHRSELTCKTGKMFTG